MKEWELIACLILAFACNRKSNSGHFESKNKEDHDEVSFQATLFSDSSEFFLQFPALITGRETDITLYITRLSSYKPYSTATIPIDFNGIQGKAVQNVTAGIFKATVKPIQAGIFPVTITIQTGTFIESVTDSLPVFANEEAAHHHEDESNISGNIRFTKYQSWNSTFSVKQVKQYPFSSVIRASGEILAMPGEKQNLAARTSGIILFASRNLVQGSRVARGELLFTLSGKDLTDNNIGVRYAEIRNSFLRSKTEYERHKRLFQEKLISEKQFIETRSKYLTDSSAYYVLSTNVSSAGMYIYAPLSGYLHELNVSEGQFVETGRLLATISTNEVLLLRADLPQQYVGQLNQIQTANFRPAYTSRIYTIEELNGRLLARGASVAENNHYIPVYFEVRNDGTLLEGAFTEFYLITRSTNNSVIVPMSSIIEEQGVYNVYVQIAGESYVKRAVTMGENDGLNTVITSGLQPGERVVNKGAMLLKAASMSVSMPVHNHEH